MLTNYEVEMDDGLGGGFITIAGGATKTYLLNDIVVSKAVGSGFVFEIQRGLHYRFRYRSQNINGWSAFSPISYIQAASKPDRPTPVTYVASTATTITVDIGACLENGGSLLTSYNLYMDDGSLTNAFVQIHTRITSGNFIATALEPGRLYIFRSTATNVIGESDPSEEIKVYAAALPSLPAPVWRGSDSTMT